MAQAQVLFDLMGVLVHSNTATHRRRVLQAVGIYDSSAPLAAEFWAAFHELRPAYVTGEVGDQRFWQQLTARVGLSDCDYAEAIAADTRPHLEADDEVRAWVETLMAQGNRVGLVGNVSLSFAKTLCSRFEWLDELDAVVLSSDLGLAKPDHRIYQVAIDALGGCAKDTFYFSTKPDYVDAARDLRIDAHEYEGLPQAQALVGVT